MEDLKIMECEADIHDALGRLSHHLNHLHQGAYLLDYKSITPEAVNFRIEFYKYLKSISDAHQSVLRLFEVTCQANGVTYTD